MKIDKRSPDKNFDLGLKHKYLYFRRTKIIATIGPASSSPEMIKALILKGLNVARINFSHGKPEEHLRTIRTIRNISAKLRMPVAILGDLCGPKIRVGRFRGDAVTLRTGSAVTITVEPVIGHETLIPCQYKRLVAEVSVNDQVLLDDGERVIYIGTLNKALFPGLRLGYAVIPRALLKPFVAARYLMDRQPSTLSQAVVAAFMHEGHFAAHIRRMRVLYRAQRDELVTTLKQKLGDALTVTAPDQGMHLVAFTRRGLSDTAIERAGRQHGVVVRPMSRLYLATPPRSALVLGFSGHARQTIAPAVERLARTIETLSMSPLLEGKRKAMPKR